MTRMRWLSAKWPLTIRKIAAKMKVVQFTQDGLDGFVVERVRESSIEGQYFEKVNYEQTIIDPFGGEVIVSRIEYKRTRFRLLATFPQIEVWDAPRSIQAFATRLAELNDFSVAIAPIDVDVGKWIEAFRRQCSHDITLQAIQAGQVLFEGGVTGTLLLKGDDAIHETLQRVVGKRSHRIERAFVRLEQENGHVSIQFSRDGSARLSGKMVEEFFEVLRTTLIETSSNSP